MDKGLIIRRNWLDRIYYHNKRWEMRSGTAKHRGRIYLIASKSGMISGHADLVDCIETDEDMRKSMQQHHQVEDLSLLEKWKFAWVLENTKILSTPIPYTHPPGAVIWVKLPPINKKLLSY